MILETFTIFLFITAILLFCGFQYRVPVLVIAGFTIMFVLGISFQAPGLEYQTSANYTASTITYIYSSYSNTDLSYLLLVISVLGFISSFFVKELWGQ